MSDLEKLMGALMEVELNEKKKLDPVGKEDDDIDNDGDTDSSDAYLKNRRKKVGAAMKKEGKIPPQFLKNVKKKKGEDDDSDDDDDKDDKKPDFLKKKEEGYGKMKKESKMECPKCKGDGCSHCDDKGYHMKEENVESSMEETLASVDTGGRMMKWTDFKEGVAGHDEITYKGKKRPQDMEIGQSSIRDVKSDKQTKGATPPEGIMDKESPKSKQFYKDHQKSDSKWENMEDEGHEDASKAMKAGPGPKLRPGDNTKGDKQIINKPTQKF